MKKIIAFVLCFMLVGMMNVAVFAAEDEVNLDETIETTIETTVESTIEATEPATEETTTETTEETPGETDEGLIPDFTTEDVVAWAMENYEELTVIFALISAALLIISRIATVAQSIAKCNNNAIAIAEESKATTMTALDQVNMVKDIVGTYKAEFEKLLAEVRQSDEEKKILKATLDRVEGFLQTSKMANKELADEMAQLLTLANIPNSVKEELHTRHRAAVAALEAAEAAQKTEVKENVGEES